MSVSIDAEKRRQTWRENGASSQGVNGLGENGAKWGVGKGSRYRAGI